MNDGGDRRTAPATPGLLNIQFITSNEVSINKSENFLKRRQYVFMNLMGKVTYWKIVDFKVTFHANQTKLICSICKTLKGIFWKTNFTWLSCNFGTIAPKKTDVFHQDGLLPLNLHGVVRSLSGRFFNFSDMQHLFYLFLYIQLTG